MPQRKKLPKDKFFAKLEKTGLAVTFSDVRLQTNYSEVMPDDVSLETRFSRNVPLKSPLSVHQWTQSQKVELR